MGIEAFAATVIALVWIWSINSARVVRLARARDISMLPLWAVYPGRAFNVLGIGNLLLMGAQFTLPIAAAMYFPWKTALVILGIALVGGTVLELTIQIVTRANPMLRYYISGALTTLVIVGGYIVTT